MSKTITPTYWTSEGFAARDNVDAHGRRVEIWAGIVGEEARVEPTGSGAHVHRARFLQPHRAPSPSRREPPCERFSLCGGCPFMHMDQAGQHAARLAMVRQVLAPVGLAAHTPAAVIPSPDGDEDFRHVIKLAVGRSDKGHLRVGTFGRGTHRVVPIPNCNVASPVLREVMKVVAHHVIELEIYPFETDTDRGTIRHIVLRQSRVDGKVLVTLVVGRTNHHVRALADAIAAGSGAVSGVYQHVNDLPGNAIFAPPIEGVPQFDRLGGEGTIEEEVAGLRLRVGPGDFFQTNPGMADRIVRDVISDLAPFKSHPVVDLYCGVGTFTLPLAREHGWALGVEEVPGAIDRAEESTRLLHLPAEFMRGAVADRLPEIARRVAGRGPVVVVDPARRGLEESVVDGIIGLKPAKVAYLSCNPRALATDLQRFVAAGWTIDSLRAYDMFPQTAHVELLALLSPPTPPVVTARAPRRKLLR